MEPPLNLRLELLEKEKGAGPRIKVKMLCGEGAVLRPWCFWHCHSFQSLPILSASLRVPAPFPV